MSADPRRVEYPPAPGLAHAGELRWRPRVAVVGGGIAGLTAATGLAERGVEVDLYERESYLGGRAGGWDTTLGDGTPVTMSRGFHAFFRQYYNLRSLLRRTDPGLRRLKPVPDYPLLDDRGRVDTFRGLPRRPPWNAMVFALRSPTFRLRDLVRIDPAGALPLAAVSVPETYHQLDDIDAASFLDRLNFPPSARHLAFEVFSRSFFASPAELSAAELVTMFHLYFLGSSEGLIFDVPEDTYPASLWDPLTAYLTDLGVRIHRGVRVDAVEPGERGGFRVRGAPVDGVVLASDVPGLREVVGASPELGTPAWRERIERLRTAPAFYVRRLWLDRPLRVERAPFLGTGSLPPLDNISVLDRFEAQAAEWAARTGGAVVELHAYAVAERSADLPDRLLDRLHEIYPETRQARIVGELDQWRQDCPLFGLGDFARRPGVETPVPGLVLAGDGIRVDLPVALMERAATTGWQAANRLLAGWGLRGHPTWSVPNQGRLGLVRALARRRAAGAG
ncbi:FAD-dependent oxidoreductase [Amycolatopsis sp. 195334CR]|uniref:hydroxysqualene dehydroxylase n=1 Tax=Amycolatopsis sp. 195334CR TaxID=2814588 RepID=UPI001A8DB497|nr:FAD-dependent oxidoreductase [Amycolatopsis sp. 195334CR]MBN6040324.1 FAD-dependent oxidoreductase [Amycolatopsis sp. 195334CR]